MIPFQPASHMDKYSARTISTASLCVRSKDRIIPKIRLPNIDGGSLYSDVVELIGTETLMF